MSRAGAAVQLRVGTVIPVGSPSALVRGCLDALAAQEPALDVVAVVDDSPAGDLAPHPVAGVTLHSGGRGPYAARNLGWRAIAPRVDVVAFVDVRSRPQPTWAAAVAATFADPEVAVAGSDVRVLGGPTVAAQVAERHQVMRLERYVAEPSIWPYLPTCNLAVRSTDLEAVDGFAEIRSGADADLCWRVLDRPGRRIATVPEVLMEWVPRDSVRDYLAQNLRYGRSNRALRRRWRAAGAPQRPAEPYGRLARRWAGVVLRGAHARARGRRDDLVSEVRKAGTLAFETGYRLADDRGGRRSEP